VSQCFSCWFVGILFQLLLTNVFFLNPRFFSSHKHTSLCYACVDPRKLTPSDERRKNASPVTPSSSIEQELLSYRSRSRLRRHSRCLDTVVFSSLDTLYTNGQCVVMCVFYSCLLTAKKLSLSFAVMLDFWPLTTQQLAKRREEDVCVCFALRTKETMRLKQNHRILMHHISLLQLLLCACYKLCVAEHQATVTDGKPFGKFSSCHCIHRSAIGVISFSWEYWTMRRSKLSIRDVFGKDSLLIFCKTRITRTESSWDREVKFVFSFVRVICSKSNALINLPSFTNERQNFALLTIERVCQMTMANFIPIKQRLIAEFNWF